MRFGMTDEGVERTIESTRTAVVEQYGSYRRWAFTPMPLGASTPSDARQAWGLCLFVENVAGNFPLPLYENDATQTEVDTMVSEMNRQAGLESADDVAAIVQSTFH